MENLVDKENLADKYGVSGINLMSVFSTTGEAPINEREISDSFVKMDQNKDNVISREEFSRSDEVSKLPDDSQDELFDEIDLNKDGVIQYNEFRTIAQNTEAKILSQQEQE